MPFPYIANEAGWTVAEVGRQPWIVYGLMRTADALVDQRRRRRDDFTLLGFGAVLVLGLLFLYS